MPPSGTTTSPRKTSRPKSSPGGPLTGNFDIPIIYAPHLVAHHQERFFRSWHQLAVSEDPVTLTRPAVDHIVLSSSRRLVDPLLLREKDNPLVKGDIVERRRMELRMVEASVEVSDEGPTKIDMTFKSLRDVSTVCLLKTENGVLKPLALPPVGDSITVPYVPFSNH